MLIRCRSRISMRCAASFTSSPSPLSTGHDLRNMADRRKTDTLGERIARLRDFLSLERNVSIASGAVFLLGFGEELWKRFLPKYLEALGASVPVTGLFGTAEDFLDGIYQYPGGWIADRLGRRRAFLFFLGPAFIA